MRLAETGFSEKLIRLFSESRECFVLALDSSGCFSSINRGGSIAMGYSLKDLKGRHFLEFIPEESMAGSLSAFQRLIDRGRSGRFKTRLLTKSNEQICYEFRFMAAASGVVGLGFNVKQESNNMNLRLTETNRLLSIEKRKIKERITALEDVDRLKNSLISSVSHELRTPLASIVGFAEAILSEKTLPRETLDEFSGIILSEGKRLARLIGNGLDLSRLSEMQTGNMSLDGDFEARDKNTEKY